MDGNVEYGPWAKAPWSERFVDCVSGHPAVLETRVKCLYDEENLYIAFKAAEPFLHADLTERDSIIFQENDLELFIDGGDSYYELEINARNVPYEVFYIWRDVYQKHGWNRRPEYDLLSTEARTFGGNYDRTTDWFWTGNHPRGDKFAFIHWDFPGMETTVHLHGTLNDDSDVDEGWVLEIKLPWAGMKDLADGRSLPPKPGDEWRFGFYRYEQLHSSGEKVNFGWGLDVVGVPDNHRPEKFSLCRFQ